MTAVRLRQSCSSCLVVSLLISMSFACRTVSAAADPDSWRQQVIYLIMPDRFSNGDAANDRLGCQNAMIPVTLPSFTEET